MVSYFFVFYHPRWHPILFYVTSLFFVCGISVCSRATCHRIFCVWLLPPLKSLDLQQTTCRIVRLLRNWCPQFTNKNWAPRCIMQFSCKVLYIRPQSLIIFDNSIVLNLINTFKKYVCLGMYSNFIEFNKGTATPCVVGSGRAAPVSDSRPE